MQESTLKINVEDKDSPCISVFMVVIFGSEYKNFKGYHILRLLL